MAASIASCSLPCSSSSLSISPGFRSSPSFRFTSSKRVSSRLVFATASSTLPSTFLARVERRLLRQVADADAVGRLGVAEEVLVDAGHDAQERRLAGAVRAEHADLGARVERQIDPLQDLLVGRVDPPEVLHRVDVLVRHGGGSLAATGWGHAPLSARDQQLLYAAETERSRAPLFASFRGLRAGTVDVIPANRTGGRAWSALSARRDQARFFSADRRYP